MEVCLDVYRCIRHGTNLCLNINVSTFIYVTRKSRLVSRNGGHGHWSTDGCNLKTGNQTHSICECTHMTNFAILMSPYVEVCLSESPTNPDLYSLFKCHQLQHTPHYIFTYTLKFGVLIICKVYIYWYYLIIMWSVQNVREQCP